MHPTTTKAPPMNRVASTACRSSFAGSSSSAAGRSGVTDAMIPRDRRPAARNAPKALTAAAKPPYTADMPDPDVSNLLTVAQAIAVIDAAPVTPRTVRLPLAQCRGLYLAQDVSADRDYPP